MGVDKFFNLNYLKYTPYTSNCAREYSTGEPLKYLKEIKIYMKLANSLKLILIPYLVYHLSFS